MATINIANLSFTHKGDYDGSTAYVKNDVVYYATNGNAYIAKQGTTGNVPTNGTYWSQFAAGSGGIWNAGLSLGSAGQAVKVNSSGNALEFGTISSDFVKLNESTASGVSSHSIDGFFSSDYDNYMLIGNGLSPSTATDLNFRFNVGGSQHSSGEYVYSSGLSYTDVTPSHLWTAGNGAYSDWNNGDDRFILGADDQNDATTHSGNIVIRVFNPLSTSIWKHMDFDWKYNYSNNWNRLMTGGFLMNTGAISGFTFYYASGTITGSFKLYGIK